MIMIRLTRLFRLGALTLLALTLMVVPALPSVAANVCSASQMLDEVTIVSVAAKASPAVWRAQGLVNFDYGRDIENGLLEVKFKDIATDFDFDGYIIEAIPGEDDPGNSRKLGVPDYKSPSLIARPTVVGATVTQVLNLEPGTKYYVTVYAVNHNIVQISPHQRAQDSRSATTLLSAPFLGALETGFFWRNVGLHDDDFKGTHFALYGVEDESGQHYFRWLNPAAYGPFDHIIIDLPDVQGSRQADMLSFDKDGNVDEQCDDAGGDCGHTHYQFKAVDDNGNTVASELVETGGNVLGIPIQFFQTVFPAESGGLTLSVSLGRVDEGKYRAMSDTASVMFDAPDDLRTLDQTYDEYRAVLDDIVGTYEENEDLVRWLGKNKTGSGGSIWNPIPGRAFETLLFFDIMIAHLNNQLK